MRPISQRQADELPCFLPDFERPGREFDEGLGGGETTENGITGFYIRYPEDVEAFFRLIEEGPLVDYNYDPEQVAAWIEDPEQIKRATIHEVRAALTYAHAWNDSATAAGPTCLTAASSRPFCGASRN